MLLHTSECRTKQASSRSHLTGGVCDGRRCHADGLRWGTDVRVDRMEDALKEEAVSDGA